MPPQNHNGNNRKPRVALFVTCLVDVFRPSVGFAAIKLIEQAGCSVDVPELQTCCGQPAYNSGDRDDAKRIARQVIAAFQGFDYVVAPSGSCTGMIKAHYPALFSDEPETLARAKELSSRTYELISFLTDVMKLESVAARFDGTATYHDSCSGLRELGVKTQPRKLLASVKGLTLTEMRDAEICCGFGGTFAVKYGDISDKIASEKCANIEAAKADALLAGDLGCLLNMAGKLKRLGRKTKTWHVAEILAGMAADGPAIGEPENES